MPTATRTKPVSSGVRYLESSAVVAGLLEGDANARASMAKAGRRLTSALTLAEVARAIVRAHAAGRISQQRMLAAQRGLRQFSRRCEIAGVSAAVLARAGQQFPVEPVRTLDAIHLATVEILGEAPENVTVVTRDVRVRDNALASGYRVE